MPRPRRADRKTFTVTLELADRNETRTFKEPFSAADVWELVIEKFGPPAGQVFIEGREGAASELSKYVVDRDAFYVTFNNHRSGPPVPHMIKDGEYRVLIENGGNVSPLPLKDIARAFTLAGFNSELADETFRSRRYGPEGYLADRHKNHDVVEWTASIPLKGMGRGIRLVLGFAPDVLVVSIDCSGLADNLAAKLFPPSHPVSVVGDTPTNPLGILVAAGVRDVVTSLPLNTIVALAEGDGLGQPASFLDGDEAIAAAAPAPDGEAAAAPAPDGVAGSSRHRRSILFVGESLSGCVAHAAALLVNLGKPAGHDELPLARSVAFGSPSCFFVGSGATKKAKSLMLQMTTVIRHGDPMIKLLTLYGMATIAVTMNPGTFALEGLTEMIDVIYTSAKTIQTFASKAQDALLRRAAQEIYNFYAPGEHDHLEVAQVGGFKSFSPDKEPGGVVVDVSDALRMALKPDKVTTDLVPKGDSADYHKHFTLPWSDKLCSDPQVWGDRVLQDNCSEKLDLLEPTLTACKIVVTSQQLEIKICGDNLEGILTDGSGVGEIPEHDFPFAGLSLRNFDMARDDATQPDDFHATPRFFVQMSTPHEATFLVTGLQVPQKLGKGAKLQVRVCTIFGVSKFFDLDEATDVILSRGLTLGERMQNSTNVAFLNSALLRCLIESPRLNGQEDVATRQSDLILGPSQDEQVGPTQAQIIFQCLCSLELCFIGTNDLVDIKAKVLAAPRSFFEAEVTNAMPRAERIFKTVMDRLTADTSLVKESRATRQGRKLLAGTGMVLGRIGMALAALLAIPGGIALLIGGGFYANASEEGASIGSRAVGILVGVPLAIAGSVALLPAAMVGYLGRSAVSSSERLYRRMDNTSIEYVKALAVVLQVLGGDPDRYMQEVRCLEDAVLEHFNDLAKAFGATADHVFKSAAEDPVAAIAAQLDIWKARQYKWQVCPDRPEHHDARDVDLQNASPIDGGDEIAAAAAPSESGADTEVAGASRTDPNRFSLAYWPTKEVSGKKQILRQLVAKHVYVTSQLKPLRQAITNAMYIMFVGVHNAGKSRLIQELWGFDTKPDALRRTETINIYRPDIETLRSRLEKRAVQADFFSLGVIDTPGASDERVGVAEMWKTFSDVVTCYVCVFRAGHVAGPERRIVAEVQQTRRPFIVLINTTPAQERALRDAGDGSLARAYQTYAQSLGVQTTELNFVDVSDPVRVEIVRRQLWAVLQPLLHPLEEATRHLALSMCHTDLVADLRPEMAGTFASVGDEVGAMLSDAVDERGPLTSAQVRKGLRQRRRVNSDLAPVLQGVGVLGRHLITPLAKQYDANILEGILVAIARVRQVTHKKIWHGAVDPTVAAIQHKMLMQSIIQAVKKLTTALQPALESFESRKRICDYLREVKETNSMERDFVAHVKALAACLTEVADTLAKEYVVEPDKARLALANLVVHDRFGSDEAIAVIRKVQRAQLEAESSTDDFDRVGAFIEDAGHAKRRLLQQSVFLTDRYLGVPKCDVSATQLYPYPACTEWTKGAKIRELEILLNSKVRGDQGGEAQQLALPNRRTAGRDFLQALATTTRSNCRSMVQHHRQFGVLLSKLTIQIVEEDGAGVDAGGVTRAVLDDACSCILKNPQDYGFRLSIGGTEEEGEHEQIYFAIVSELSDAVLCERYRAVGRLMGIIVAMPGATMGLDFAPAVYKLLFGEMLDFSDFADIDGVASTSVMQLASFDHETFNSMSLEWSVTTPSQTLLPLDPKRWDSEDVVRFEHRMRYFRRKIEFSLGLGPHLVGAIREFVLGFGDVVDRDLFAILSPKEMKDVVEGQRTIDVDDMIAHTAFSGTAEEGNTLHAHWIETMHAFTSEQQLLLLRFWTGTSRPPAGGFEDFGDVLKVQGARRSDSLPRAQTCFYSISVPDYGSQRVLQDKLLQAITETGAADFGFA